MANEIQQAISATLDEVREKIPEAYQGRLKLRLARCKKTKGIHSWRSIIQFRNCHAAEIIISTKAIPKPQYLPFGTGKEEYIRPDIKALYDAVENSLCEKIGIYRFEITEENKYKNLWDIRFKFIHNDVEHYAKIRIFLPPLK